MTLSRRRALAIGALGAAGLAVLLPIALRKRTRTSSGGLVERGPLRVPEGFEVTVLSRAGDEMRDGFRVPGLADGMAAFDRGDRIVLMRNHELATERALSAYPDGPAPAAAFDKASYGAVTRLVVEKRSLAVLEQNLVLTGTSRNCAGGPSPWGWLSCEEDPRPGHGFVFACSDAATELAAPVQIPAYGRFRHEAVCVDPETLEAYLTEDQPDGCLYRFVPKSRETPHEGTLFALALADGSRSTGAFRRGDSAEVRWIALEDPTPREDVLRSRAIAQGAAVVVRGEGVFFRRADGRPEITFAATAGGPSGRGQLFVLRPTVTGGTLACVFDVTDETLDMPDNLYVGDAGLVFVAEDGTPPNGVRVVSPDGRVTSLCENTGAGEVAGVTLVGDTLFLNLQQRGLTLALRGPFERLA